VVVVIVVTFFGSCFDYLKLLDAHSSFVVSSVSAVFTFEVL